MTGGYFTGAPFRKQKAGRRKSTERPGPNAWRYGSRSTLHRGGPDCAPIAINPSIFQVRSAVRQFGLTAPGLIGDAPHGFATPGGTAPRPHCDGSASARMHSEKFLLVRICWIGVSVREDLWTEIRQSQFSTSSYLILAVVARGQMMAGATFP